MNPQERKQRRAANLRRPRTQLADAFLRALFDWASRHANDDTNTTISIPTGVVTTDELSKVVIALISLESGKEARPDPTSPVMSSI
jgi:hypothetical protein